MYFYTSYWYNVDMESLQFSKPHLIILVGIPGAGKSFFAEHFAETFKSPLVSTEIIRNKLFSVPSYNADEDIIIDTVSDYLLDEVLKTNRTIVYRGKSASRANRAELVKKCRSAGYEPLIVWVQTDIATAKKRYVKAIKVETAAEKFETELKKFAPPHAIEGAVVISGKHTYDSQLKIVLKKLVSTENAIKSTGSNPNLEKRSHLIS